MRLLHIYTFLKHKTVIYYFPIKIKLKLKRFLLLLSDKQRIYNFTGEDLPVARVIPNVTVSYGDSVRLYCNLTHKNNERTTPIDKVTYLRGNNPVKITNDVTQALIFNSVRVSDGGNYVCRIRVLLHSRVPYNVTSSPGYLHSKQLVGC